MKHLVLFFLFSFLMASAGWAQGETLDPNIKSVKLYRYGDQISFPAINLNELNGLEVHFDDFDTRIKNY